jgi:hypothetical protein
MRRAAHHDLAAVGPDVVAPERLKDQKKLFSKHGWALAGEYFLILSACFETEYEVHHIRRGIFDPARFPVSGMFREVAWPDRAAAPA